MADRKPAPALAVHCEHCGSAPLRDGDVLRCECGSLLARFVEGRIELKCRRCKRTVMLAVQPVENSRTS